ncbi:MAG: DUF5662 family protein [Candidatus Limivivens sp.]|nr:DUF5662 family protein [Candidatus Limivivens sp.]
MMFHPIKHFKTITSHKILVMKSCFRVGLYRQGLMHDMSKYFPTEFLVGCKYWQGFQSPNNAERLDKGYSQAWLHHKGRNRHHFEYWIDYSIQKDGHPMEGMKMPRKYVAEMLMDRIAASKIYNGEAYTDHDPLTYFRKGKQHYMIHPETARQLEKLLVILDRRGEEYLYWYVKNRFLKGRD